MEGSLIVISKLESPPVTMWRPLVFKRWVRFDFCSLHPIAYFCYLRRYLKKYLPIFLVVFCWTLDVFEFWFWLLWLLLRTRLSLKTSFEFMIISYMHPSDQKETLCQKGKKAKCPKIRKSENRNWHSFIYNGNYHFISRNLSMKW